MFPSRNEMAHAVLTLQRMENIVLKLDYFNNAL